MKEIIQSYFENLPTLESDRIILRPLRENDLPELWAYAEDPKISEYTTWEYHQNIETTKSYLTHILKNYSEGNIENWGIELRESRKIIGMAGFGEVSAEHKRGEVGYVLARNYWNQGLMTEAIKLVLREGFLSLKLEKILGRCISENSGSKKVLIKVGFSKEGHLRSHYIKNKLARDIEIFGILRSEFHN